jgi:hypothetical protein
VIEALVRSMQRIGRQHRRAVPGSASMNTRVAVACALAAGSLLASPAYARPIVLADGTTAMGEYGAGTMNEFQVFYAPDYRYSFGVGYLELNSHVNATPGSTTSPGHSHGGGLNSSSNQSSLSHDITYLRLNYLPKRWNMESAQANVLVWGSVGRVNLWKDYEQGLALNIGGQVDYETRRVYASLRTDLYEASVANHRIDTLQLGIAPYEHEYNTLALWFVVQARQYAGEQIHEGTEIAGLLRLFSRKTWIEAGVTQDGHVQAMLMFNF